MTRYILAGRLIDGSGAGVRRRVLLEVQDARITALGPATTLPARFDDLSHCTLVPALVDSSLSLLRSPSLVAAAPIEKAALVQRHIHYCYIHGVLGLAVHDDPDLLPSYLEAEGQPSALNICTARADFLRIVYSKNIEDQAPAEQGGWLPQRGAKKMLVLANGPQAVARALEAGCAAIEQGYGMGEDNLRKMAAQGVLWIPSLVRAKNALDSACGGGDVCCRFSTRYVAPGKAQPDAAAFWHKTLAQQLALLGLARKLGVQVAVGTGAGSPGILHGESVVEEMKLLIKAGYSLEEAVRCASVNGARFFGMDFGKLAVGYRASFLFTRGTSQQLPRKLAYLEGMYIDGEPSVPTTFC